MVGPDTLNKREMLATNRVRAKEMRHHAVAMEKLFWSRLRDRKLGGFKFRRQCPIGPYIADFVCPEVKLIVELDGPLHEGRIDYDRRRDRFLRSEGYRVMRFKNAELKQTCQQSCRLCRPPHPGPLPLRGRGSEFLHELPNVRHSSNLSPTQITRGWPKLTTSRVTPLIVMVLFSAVATSASVALSASTKADQPSAKRHAARRSSTKAEPRRKLF